MTRSQEWQLAGWSLFALAFAVAGAIPIEAIRRQPQVPDQSPLNSTDAVFLQTLGLHDGSTRIRELLRALPRDRPLAIVQRDDHTLAPAAGQVSVLSWPRAAPWLRVARAGDPELANHISVHQPAAAFFLSVDPPPGMGLATALSPELRFVRIDAAR